MNSSFFPDLCFILQLYIHYAGEHQSQPIHGYQTESYISEGEGLFMSRSGTKYADYNMTVDWVLNSVIVKQFDFSDSLLLDSL